MFSPRTSVDDLDFGPTDPVSAALLEKPARGTRPLVWLIGALIGCAIAWAHYASLDEVTRGAGKVIPSQQTQVVQNLEGGIVSEILIKEGDIVAKGDVLLRIDDTRFSSSFRENRSNYLARIATAARLRAEATGTPFEPPSLDAGKEFAINANLIDQEQALFAARQKELQSTLGILAKQATQRQQELTEVQAKYRSLQRTHALLRKELAITKPLVAQGAAAEVDLLRLRRASSQLRGEMETAKLAAPRLQAAYDEAQQKSAEAQIRFRNKARAELNKLTAELSGLDEANTALADRVERTAVRSPVHGTVNRILINTVGGVVRPGMDIVEIVPLEDSLQVEAQVRPEDIAFLSAGQRATVKFTAYDSTRYGSLEGRLEHISVDTIKDDQGESFYLVRIRTDETHLENAGQTLPIIPGMVASVDILTGKKTVLNYLLKPILRASDAALTER
ncbi:MAG: HlyD family type I secretion periplasmic adaptor subunit [Gammaproteobacteria bacterium]|nr:HlyD family type I secretion periplasmic adaptor subunit [Gammaproteobacteria bacterium]